ncbi:hypothetical protein ZOSMA_22G00820 [Zostera marina]|uniref:VHS domain-containing protein n=1 Tax=Zostera marina TaxID=29655 RepID=A0A0K9PKM5_ZOSMR|nr:hypothetical protein ZOSMA_22G00820 [Zostera marina]
MIGMSSEVVDLVNVATNEKITDLDWTINIMICELVANDPRKDAVKSIQRRLRNKSARIQFYSVRLLEILLNNCGQYIYKLVIDYGILAMLVKIFKKKSDFPIQQSIFFLIDAVQRVVGGSSGKFPQYHAAYLDLMSTGVKFPQQSTAIPSDPPIASNPIDNATNQGNVSTNGNGAIEHPVPQPGLVAETFSLLEVFRDVLNDQHYREGASSDLLQDLVEKCSSQKEKLVRFIINSSDETVDVKEAIELIGQMNKLITKRNALVSLQSTSATTSANHEETDAEEEDCDHEFNRMDKGKDCVIDDYQKNPYHTINSSSPWSLPARSCIYPIPPPPTMYREREIYFMEREKSLKENQAYDGLSNSGRMREQSLHSLNSSTISRSWDSGITDFSDQEP